MHHVSMNSQYLSPCRVLGSKSVHGASSLIKGLDVSKEVFLVLLKSYYL